MVQIERLQQKPNAGFSSILHRWHDFFIYPRRPKWGLPARPSPLPSNETEWIEARIDSGAFTSESEYIRDSIRRDQARQFEVEAIRGELIKGEESGEPQAFNGDPFKEQMAAKHARRVR